jgi:hypothetical protein
MDAHLSATLENTTEPEGNAIRRAPAGYLVRSVGVIVRAVEVHHVNIRSAGPLRTPAGPRPPAGSVEWWPKELACGWPCLASCRATYGIGTRPRNSPNRIHRTGLHRSRDRTCGRLPQALATVGPHG